MIDVQCPQLKQVDLVKFPTFIQFIYDINSFKQFLKDSFSLKENVKIVPDLFSS